ncbi:MAG TPA: HAD family hydrolase [Anaeromyxobacteraceae bacterium]|nr:HAD family hydrolase [Anaeromyxobacteraceae bacterium]
MARAVLFDIDGTLIDSVDLHAQAWQEALARFGKEVEYQAIRSQIGKGGDQLLPVFLSEEERERFGEELEEHRASLYQRRYLPLARPFPEARELLARLKQSGVLVGLASSCRRTELGYYLRMVGGAKLVDAATTSDDADRSKPFPDVFEACLDRLGLEPGEAVAVGDSPFDAEAAGRAGVATVGVLCGGFEERTLRAAGCVAVYADPAELLARLPQTPLAPEPHAGPPR